MGLMCVLFVCWSDRRVVQLVRPLSRSNPIEHLIYISDSVNSCQIHKTNTEAINRLLNAYSIQNPNVVVILLSLSCLRCCRSTRRISDFLYYRRLTLILFDLSSSIRLICVWCIDKHSNFIVRLFNTIHTTIYDIERT